MKGPAFGLTGRAVPGLQGLPAPLQPPAGLGIHSLHDPLLLLVPSPIHIQTWLCPRALSHICFSSEDDPGSTVWVPAHPPGQLPVPMQVGLTHLSLAHLAL